MITIIDLKMGYNGLSWAVHLLSSTMNFTLKKHDFIQKSEVGVPYFPTQIPVIHAHEWIFAGPVMSVFVASPAGLGQWLAFGWPGPRWGAFPSGSRTGSQRGGWLLEGNAFKEGIAE